MHDIKRRLRPTTDDSQRLIGQSAAADLLGGGQLWVRIGSRKPLEGYGVRTRPDLLERFVRALRTDEAPRPGFDDAYQALTWRRAALRSQAEGRLVFVPPSAAANSEASVSMSGT